MLAQSFHFFDFSIHFITGCSLYLFPIFFTHSPTGVVCKPRRVGGGSCELVAVVHNSVKSVIWVFISSDPREVCMQSVRNLMRVPWHGVGCPRRRVVNGGVVGKEWPTWATCYVGNVGIVCIVVIGGIVGAGARGSVRLNVSHSSPSARV